jgi:hypothetical protein
MRWFLLEGCGGQVTPQQGAAVVKSPLDRGDGKRKKVGDARDRPLLVIKQEQDGAVVGRKNGKRAGKPFVVVVAGEGVGGVFDLLGGGEGKFAASGKQRAVHFGWLDGVGAVVFRADAQGAVPRDGV